MTLLELWVYTPLAQSLGSALLHSLWEGLVIALLLAAALRVIRTSGARYGAACVAMLLTLASFGVTLIRVMPGPIELTRSSRGPIHAAPSAALPIGGSSISNQPAGLAALLPWIALFWAAGVLIFHLRSLAGWMMARRLRRSGVCVAADAWQERLLSLAGRMRVSKAATLFESCLAEAPLVIGHLRPVILMPVGLLAGLPTAQVEAILMHELAHIRRQDYLVNLMQTFVEGLLFYHPAVWWTSGVIRTERENCCDDLAVAATGDARQYAVALAALEQNRWTSQELAMAATGGSLVKRIRRLLLQPERPRTAWTPIISAGLLVISGGIAFATWQKPEAPKPQPAASTSLLASTYVQAQPTPAKQPAPKLLAQAAPVATPPVAQSADPQEQKLSTPYRKWLNEDVAYIINDAERATFKSLTNDDEREKFIEQFWVRRDPTPASAENEFKEEHYRRIAYANEHFAPLSGIPGWKTDRGRIYITFGPPDEIEDHSAGGAYTRPAEQGGGVTTTYPFQQWKYRHIDGIGNNIVIEFIDPTNTREFRMTSDPHQKELAENNNFRQRPIYSYRRGMALR